MKSNFDDLTSEEKLKTSESMLMYGSGKVNELIDGLTSSSLKKVLKFVSHIHLADTMLSKTVDTKLSEKEQKLIDQIFALQENVLGHQALQEEIMNELQQDPLKPVELTTKGDNNE
jgi:hypothetical protein